MEKIYSVLHSASVLGLFLSILLLAKVESAVPVPPKQGPLVAQEKKWNGFPWSSYFSWETVYSKVGLNLLPSQSGADKETVIEILRPISFSAKPKSEKPIDPALVTFSLK